MHAVVLLDHLSAFELRHPSLSLISIMTGRAGRKGKDEIGESYVCCDKADLEEVVQLLDADLPSVESSLTPDQRGIKR